MFNLLMFSVEWSSGSVMVPRERMFEYTDDLIIRQFRENGTPQLARLCELPCLFCNEGKKNETAYVGRISTAKSIGKDISLEISIDSEVSPLQNRMLYDNRSKLRMSDSCEFSRNHWAIKDVDLYRFLLHHTLPRRQRQPPFNIPEYEDIDQTQASVMMPFDANFDAVYKTIQQASRNVGLSCKRVDDMWENDRIIQDIVTLIYRSRIVVCDCSYRNPNVFYEAGIAHTLGRAVILITQNKNDIPFDLRHLRYIYYLNNAEGREELRQELQKRMQTLLEQ